MRARIAVIACRDRIAESLVDALRRSPHVELCERASHDPERIEAAAFSGYDTVVCSPLHSGSATTGPDLAIAREVCARLASLPLKQAVVLGSAAVYSPNHQNAGLLDEATFIPEGRSEIADGWREVEAVSTQIGERSGAPPPIHTILRSAAVLDGEDYFSRLLTGRVAITYPGHDPTIQLLSPQDLAGAVAAVIEHRAGGIYNVAPAAGIPLKAALRVAGVPRLPLGRLAQNAVRTIASSASLSVPPDQLKYIQFSWTVSADKLRRDTDFSPSRTSEEAILELTGTTHHPDRPGTMSSAWTPRTSGATAAISSTGSTTCTGAWRSTASNISRRRAGAFWSGCIEASCRLMASWRCTRS